MARRPKPQENNEPEPAPPGPLAPASGNISRQRVNPPAPQQSQISVERWEYQSPLPPPNIMAAYEHLLPGATERLLARVEKQSEHRMHLEKTHLEGDVWARKAGVFAATILCALAIIGSVVVSYIGKQWQPLGFGGLALLIPAFLHVWSRKDQRAEREDKTETMRQIAEGELRR